MTLIDPCRIGHEFMFGAGDVHVVVTAREAQDLRRVTDRLRLRRFRPEAPRWSWDESAREFRFAAGGGASGSGTLWTRPIALPGDARVVHAFATLLERVDGDPSPIERLVGIVVRDAPRVGLGHDSALLASWVPGLDPPSRAWRARIVHIGSALSAPTRRARFASLAIKIDVPPTTRIGYALRGLAVSVAWSPYAADTPVRRLVPAPARDAEENAGAIADAGSRAPTPTT